VPRARRSGSRRDPIHRKGSPPRRTVLPGYSRLSSRNSRERNRMAETALTWLGHAAFRVDTADGKRIYVDPFLSGNPKCPQGEQTPERVDVIAVTHGHADHVGDTVGLATKHGSPVVAQVELAGWLGRQGVDQGKLVAPNKGGT